MGSKRKTLKSKLGFRSEKKSSTDVGVNNRSQKKTSTEVGVEKKNIVEVKNWFQSDKIKFEFLMVFT